jgi:hypothetical protein
MTVVTTERAAEWITIARRFAAGMVPLPSSVLPR